MFFVHGDLVRQRYVENVLALLHILVGPPFTFIYPDSSPSAPALVMRWRLLRAFVLEGLPRLRETTSGWSFRSCSKARRLLLRIISPITSLIRRPHSGASNRGYSFCT